MPHARRSQLLLFAACLTFAACGGGTTVVAPTRTAPSSTPSSAPPATPTPVASAAAPSPTASGTATQPPVGPVSPSSIYLGDMAQGAVLIYSSTANASVSPSAIIAGSNTGFTDGAGSSPVYGIAVDSAGTVYVLTQTIDSTNALVTAESILVFPAGTTGNVAPVRTIALGTAIDAESLAVASSQLYVTDDSGSGAIDVYPSTASGATTPLRIFSAAGGFSDAPLKVSVDGAGDAYVATYDPSATAAAQATQGVFVFPPSAAGPVAATSSITGSNTGFGSGVLDAAVVDGTGRVDAVLDDSTNDLTADISQFAPGANGNAAPATSFADTSSQGPIDGAVDSAGAFYVSEIGDASAYAQVNVFAPGIATPQQTIHAYRAVLPLIALGPYVATSPSASMQLPIRRSRAITAWRERRRGHVFHR